MANNVTLSGILNANDLATDGANFAGAGNVRFDEYIVNVDRDGTTVTLEIDNAALVIDAPDITNGSELTQPVVLPAGTQSFRVIVGQAAAGDQSYSLTARTDTGNVTLSSLGVASTQQPSTGQTVSLPGVLNSSDLLVPVSTTEYSLADEYVVKPNISGNVTIEVSGATGTGFTPNLQLIDAAGVVTNIGGAVTTAAFNANSATRVRVLNTGGSLGTDASAQYNIAFAAATGSLTVTPIQAISGSGQVEHNTPTLSAAPGAVAADTAAYLRYNIGEQGPAGANDATQLVNEFNFITLSGGDDTIDLGNIPASQASVLTDLQAGLNTDGSANATARWIVGLDGNDTFTGTAGNDAPMTGNKGNDTFNLGDGADVAVAGQGSDVINGDGGNDQLGGNLGNDSISGGAGDDILFGGGDDDILNGGAGMDTLSGDRGRDFLTGGSEADTFVLSTATAADTPAQADVITDFTAGQSDKIQITGVGGFTDLTLEGIDLLIDGNLSTNATALKVTSSGQYVGIVDGISPFDLAENSSLFTFA
ncbi:MAG: calcium-binding protein [Geitlerinemataceae cyanobacterium]